MIHLDLMSGNILLDIDEKRLILYDFDVAQIGGEPGTRQLGQHGHRAGGRFYDQFESMMLAINTVAMACGQTYTCPRRRPFRRAARQEDRRSALRGRPAQRNEDDASNSAQDERLSRPTFPLRADG